MPRESNPNRNRAKEIWLEHKGKITNRQIAELIGEDEKKIAVWKQRDKWSALLNGNVVQQSTDVVQQNKSNVVQQKEISSDGDIIKKSRGAQKGNKNAVGNRGGPGGTPGNKNAVTTGEYESIWFDCLTEEEQAICGSINTDTLLQIENDIILITIRERRMMERIRQLMKGLTEKEKKILQELRTLDVPITLYNENNMPSQTILIPETKMVITEITETECRVIDDILKLEEALTRIQDKKTRQLALKHSIETSAKGGEGDEAAKDHAKRVEEAWANR